MPKPIQMPGLEAYEQYAEKASAPESKLLKQLRLETFKKVPVPQQMAGVLQGRFLSFVTRLVQAKRVLEVGTFVGYSALCFAEALPARGKVVTLEHNPGVAAFAQRYFDKTPLGKKIEIKQGPALETLKTLKGTFDLVYIDADKANYKHYFEEALRLTPPKGLIIADNLFWKGAVLKSGGNRETRALRAFAKQVRKDVRVEPFLLPLRDGLLMVRKW